MIRYAPLLAGVLLATAPAAQVPTNVPASNPLVDRGSATAPKPNAELQALLQARRAAQARAAAVEQARQQSQTTMNATGSQTQVAPEPGLPARANVDVNAPESQRPAGGTGSIFSGGIQPPWGSGIRPPW